MPLMATIRQLGRLTANGTIKPLSDEAKMVRDRLVNDEQISRSRIHPMHYLLAAKNYAAGQGFRGSLSWNTNSQIMDALNTGFYKSFANVEPTGKAFLIGVDVSGSMSAQIAGSNISAAEAAGAIAMVIARTESNYEIHGFTAGSTSRAYYLSDNSPAGRMSGFVDLGIHAKDSLENVMAKVRKNNFGRTDCALPMLYALENGIKVDAFVVITDNETWAGDIKPAAALREYRTKVNPGAKLVVLATSASGFSIADPNDAGMLDICGFDAAVPQLIAEFVK
jgi:60 kDa SS-A/Ro ribonucleoprotein